MPGPLRGTRCFVEPSPAGGYFVRLRGEPVPLSRHDTEEEAEAAAAAYERGREAPELVVLDDGREVLIRTGELELRAFDGEREVGSASWEADMERPHVAVGTVTVAPEWEPSGLRTRLERRLRELAHEARIRELRL
jgi:hypothetical protein